MSRRLGFAVLLAGLLLLPGVAYAQRGMRGNRGGPAMTPYGPVFNPALSPEWRQAGGNMEAYQQLMMQKMAAAEQAAFQKQMAEYQKSLNSKDKGKAKTPTATTTTPDRAPARVAKKKKATLKPSTTAAKPKPADTPEGGVAVGEDTSTVAPAKTTTAKAKAPK